MKIYVKNMACESCKIFVKEALDELGIPLVKVELGEVETKEDVSDEDKRKLNNKINKAGLELLEKKQGVLIEKIRKVAIDYVYHSVGGRARLCQADAGRLGAPAPGEGEHSGY